MADGSVGVDEDTANVLEVFCLERRAATFSLALRLSWLFDREPGAGLRSEIAPIYSVIFTVRTQD